MTESVLYTDLWQHIGRFLNGDDLFSFMLTCKNAYKACKRTELRNKMSHPMLYPWRLTYEQRNIVKNLEKGTTRFKLIHGDVGSGKTIVSISYAVRNYTKNPNSKVIMCGPPNLITMWWTTLRKYFNIEPFVLHGTNPKYNAKESWKEVPAEQFILISYKLLGYHNIDSWIDKTRDLLIIDEAHHHVRTNLDLFKEVIGLSATTNKKVGLSTGIRSILTYFGLKPEECTYTLNKEVIAKSLPGVKYHSYFLKSGDNVNNAAKNAIKYARNQDQDLTCINEICKLISHPEILDLRDKFTTGYIMVGRKSLRVDIGNSELLHKAETDLILENPGLNGKTFKDKLLTKVTFDIVQLGNTYPKYVQLYHIIKNANKNGDKVLVFDNSVTYLPFIHKFLTAYGINSYIFSTHYEVSGRQRQLTKFKEDTKPGVLLSSIAMLGEGQNVTEANHVVFFSHNLDPTKYYQAIGRCWRYPQNKIVNVHLIFGNEFEKMVYFHACGSIDIKSQDWMKLLSS